MFSLRKKYFPNYLKLQMIDKNITWIVLVPFSMYTWNILIHSSYLDNYTCNKVRIHCCYQVCPSVSPKMFLSLVLYILSHTHIIFYFGYAVWLYYIGHVLQMHNKDLECSLLPQRSIKGQKWFLGEIVVTETLSTFPKVDKRCFRIW